ncbi:MAG: branched-chain amino acid ABC transporter permease [Fimbriimonadales bacterium]
MKLVGWLLLCVVALGLPWGIPEWLLTTAILTLLYAYLSQSWNLVGGFAGQLSLGDAIYFGAGGYLATVLNLKLGLTPWVGLWFGGLLGAALAVAIGAVSFRFGLRGIYFAVATLAMAELTRAAVLESSFLGGSWGLQLPLKNAPASFQFPNPLPYYYIVLIMLILITLVAWHIRRSRIGYCLLAIREREDSAEALGVNAYRCKLWAAGLSGFFTAVGGVFHAQFILYLQPDTNFGLDIIIRMVLGAVLGGKGTVVGPILGSTAFAVLDEVVRLIPLSTSQSAATGRIIYGLAIMAVVIFLPSGLVSLPERLRAWTSPRVAHPRAEEAA